MLELKDFEAAADRLKNVIHNIPLSTSCLLYTSVVDRADVCRPCGKRHQQYCKTSGSQLFHSPIPFQWITAAFLSPHRTAFR